MKILLSHSFGPKNLGDTAIRNSAFKIIDHLLKEKKYYLLSEHVEDFPINSVSETKIEKSYLPYGKAIESKKRKLSLGQKFFRMIEICLLSFVYTGAGLINESFIPKNGFYKYINWIREADTVVLMGGGYFVTRKNSDLFGVILNSLPLYIAKVYRKNILILPISFGPFYNTLHESIIGNAITNTKTYSRDLISLNFIKKYNWSAEFLPDMALYDWNTTFYDAQSYYILTLREFLPPKQQAEIENELADYIKHMYDTHKLRCVFVPMAFNEIEENDVIVGKRIGEKFRKAPYYEVKNVKSTKELLDLITKSKFSICTRMHSAILSITRNKPIITINYEHKVKGLMEFLGLSAFNIEPKQVNVAKLENLSSNFIQTKFMKNYQTSLTEKRSEVMNYKKELEQAILLALGNK